MFKKIALAIALTTCPLCLGGCETVAYAYNAPGWIMTAPYNSPDVYKLPHVPPGEFMEEFTDELFEFDIHFF